MPKYDDNTIDKIMDMYLSEGKSGQVIAKELGIPRSTVYYYIQKNSKYDDLDFTKRNFRYLINRAKHLESVVAVLQESQCSPNDPLKIKLKELERLSGGKYNVHVLCEALNVPRGTYYRDVCHIEAGSLELSMLTAENVSSFLDWLEESRMSTIATRNQRLAVIKGFTRYLQYRFPEYSQNYMDIMDLRKKKGPRPVIPFLTEAQLELLFSKPDASTKKGLRDLALLVLMYDSGARVQEIADAKVKDIRLDKPAMITLTGKGSKTRQVPLMKNTCQLMKSYFEHVHFSHENNASPLFYNCHNEHLTRYGITYILKKYVSSIDEFKGIRISPHVLRHTKAMHMLQAGVNLVYIRDFLGHAQITTTEIYARADPETKRKLFEENVPNFTANEAMPWNEDADLLEWLTSFGKSYDKQ